MMPNAEVRSAKAKKLSYNPPRVLPTLNKLPSHDRVSGGVPSRYYMVAWGIWRIRL
jgi:hypothetical protein